MRVMIVVLALGLAAEGASAQSHLVDSTPRSAWTHAVAHYGKWVAAAGAVAFTALAIEQHTHSNNAWNSLLALCNSNSNNCVVGADGRYRNYQSEYYYQLALYYDHRARWRLITGQVSLLGAVGLFVADMKGRRTTTTNQPVHPLKLAVTPTPDGATVALHFAF